MRLLLAAALAIPVTLAAQGPAIDPAIAQAAISRLDFMVGRWKGDAWQQRGPERVQTQMLEVVEKRLDGAVLVVEGRGTVSAGGQERVVHHAFGIISFDPMNKTYSLRSHLANGLSGDFALTLVDGGVSWTREVPGGRVRNTARYTADEWHEVGEFSRDGSTWTQVMELRLKRER